MCLVKIVCGAEKLVLTWWRLAPIDGIENRIGGGYGAYHRFRSHIDVPPNASPMFYSTGGLLYRTYPVNDPGDDDLYVAISATFVEWTFRMRIWTHTSRFGTIPEPTSSTLPFRPTRVRSLDSSGPASFFSTPIAG
jgi:hypothetical protein